MSERVLVVPTSVFHNLGSFQGFQRDSTGCLGELLRPENLSYRPRSEVEQDPSFKQIIPYVILRWDDQVFSYTRGKRGGEERLHALQSIGVGGHISAADRNLFDANPYAAAMQRELAEEVAIEAPYTERLIGLINDDETPVGRVHLGIVHLFDLQAPAVRGREQALSQARFAPLADLVRRIDRFETWSQYCLRELAGRDEKAKKENSPRRHSER